MKKLSFLALSFLFTMLLVACGGGNGETDTDTGVKDDGVVTDDYVPPVDNYVPPTDEEEVDETPDEDVVTPCKLEDTFFDAMPAEWTAFFTMKMSGIINDANNQDPDMAFLAKVSAKLLDTTYNLASSYGMYILDSVQDVEGNTYPAVIGVAVGNLKWPVTNKLASLWAGQLFWVVDDLTNWKEQAELEGYTGVTIEGTTQVVIFEVWLEVTTAAQYTRMECIRGIGPLNAEETAYEGGMFVCIDGNTEWAIGEQMKAMDYAKLIDDPIAIIALLNEGLETSDPNYRTDVCRCWEQDGTTVIDCEDMKDEFGVGELPDEEPDADVVTDEEVTDEEVDVEVSDS